MVEANAGARDTHVALLFGASRGIGAAAAEAFAARGARVCLAARSGERLGLLRERLGVAGHDCWSRTCDVGDGTQVTSVVDEVVQSFGRLDTVIDFAAFTGPLDRAVWEVDPETWASVMSTNLDGVFNIARAAVPALLRQGQGHLILASSPFADAVTPGMGVYAASRAASHALVRHIAAELQGSQVSASVVYPGMTDTEGLSDFRRARGGTAFAQPPVSAETMADLFVWAALQPPGRINGEVLAWTDPRVRAEVMNLPPA